MAKEILYEVVEIETTDKSELLIDHAVASTYTLKDWENVLIVHVDPDFDIHAHSTSIRRAFGYGEHRPVIFTKAPIKFMKLAKVETPGFFGKLFSWTRKKDV